MASITLTNLAGYTLGVPNVEVSINVQKVTTKTTTEKIEVKDNIGHVIGRVDHNLKQEYTIEGYITGNAGVMDAMVGGIMIVAAENALGFGQLAGGAFLLDDIQRDDETATLSKVNYKVTRYPDIPATATQSQL
jgi:hypothetical protein